MIFLFGAAVLAGFWESARRKRKKLLLLGHSRFVTVVEYRPEFGRVAGSWTALDYPYVAYQDDEGTWQTERLKYATSSGRAFFISLLIEVVQFEGILYYRPTLESWNLPAIGVAVGALILALVSLVPGLASWLDF
ncbi:hypothetical protein [Hymenobacter sp. UYCo722]|uniref:hypothetical protein n=1 Tax=Hymenobacter sp. UYCo722 TaxID=3156335 RepID=UPI0033950170